MMKQAKVKIMKRFVCMLVVIGLLLTLAPMAALAGDGAIASGTDDALLPDAASMPQANGGSLQSIAPG